MARPTGWSKLVCFECGGSGHLMVGVDVWKECPEGCTPIGKSGKAREDYETGLAEARMGEAPNRPGSTMLHADLLRENGSVPIGVSDESVDLVVTSPPYFQADGCTPELARAFARFLARTLKAGAWAFVVLGQVKEDFDRVYDFRHAMLEVGRPLGLFGWQTQAWVKSIAMDGDIDKAIEEVTAARSALKHANEESVELKEAAELVQKAYDHVDRALAALKEKGACRGHVTPLDPARVPRQLNDGFEFVLAFTKGDPEEARDLDRLSIGVPYADKGNLTRGTRGKNGDTRCGGSAFFCRYETRGQKTKKAHRHEYPIDLARRLVRLGNVPKDGVVCDPFMGGGTTAEAARELGLNVVGVDRDASCVRDASDAWAAVDKRVAWQEEADVASAYADVEEACPKCDWKGVWDGKVCPECGGPTRSAALLKRDKAFDNPHHGH